ncbi:MAG TPA: hypothetical protein VNO33_15010 [Kofleriaceae bacterium]|nr:hypothetical protein [Kofleriaceae bacterium]
MVDLTVKGDRLSLQVRGLDRLWAMRSRLDLPIASVRAVRIDPRVARGLWKGVSAPGTHIPGIIIAGTFYQDDKRIFWDVHDPEKTVVIDLVGQRYDQLIVEVHDPESVVKMLERAIEAAGSAGGGDLGPSAAAPNG